MSDAAGFQLPLLGAAVVSKPQKKQQQRTRAPLARDKPVARVIVDQSLPHLDRLFDYVIPEALSDDAQPGVRLRVRFSGRLTDAWLVSRHEQSEHPGRLLPIERILSPVPVFDAQFLRLCRHIADRYAGTLPDVLRAAIPPRHARAEKAVLAQHKAAPLTLSDELRSHGQRWLAELTEQLGSQTAGVLGLTPEPQHAVWTLSLGRSLWGEAAKAAGVTLAQGRSVLLLVPDAHDLARMKLALERLSPEITERVTTLQAEDGPERRYRQWLRAKLGQAQLVLGTRAATFAQLPELALMIVLSDGDASYQEPRAPGWHTREVLLQRAHLERTSLLLMSRDRTPEAELLVQTGWAHDVSAPRLAFRTQGPAIRTVADVSDRGRLPGLAWREMKQALSIGPVLVQVARKGGVRALACRTCRALVRCPECESPLGAHSSAQLTQNEFSCFHCGWVGHYRSCTTCRGKQFNPVTLGASRTAEDLGRIFPEIPVHISTGDHRVSQIPFAPALVVATPGAEPDVAAELYQAALLLDTETLLNRPDLRAGEEIFRHWLTIASLVRPEAEGGVVVVTGPPHEEMIQAFLRRDPIGLARRELSRRTQALLPPSYRYAVLEGEHIQLKQMLEWTQQRREQLEPVLNWEVLGPIPLESNERPRERYLVRVARQESQRIGPLFQAVLRRCWLEFKNETKVRVRIDPPHLDDF